MLTDCFNSSSFSGPLSESYAWWCSLTFPCRCASFVTCRDLRSAPVGIRGGQPSVSNLWHTTHSHPTHHTTTVLTCRVKQCQQWVTESCSLVKPVRPLHLPHENIDGVAVWVFFSLSLGLPSDVYDDDKGIYHTGVLCIWFIVEWTRTCILLR